MAGKPISVTSLLLVLTAIGVVAALAPLPAVFRLMPVLPLVLWLPGYGIVRGALGEGAALIETCVLTIGMSLSICAVGGVVLDAAGALTPLGWAIYLAAASLVSIFAGRRHFGQVRLTLPARVWPTPLNAMSVVLALGLAVAALHLVKSNALAQREFAFTEMWLVRADGMSNGITLGITNQESHEALYDIEVLTDGRLTNNWSGIRVEPGQTWSHQIASGPHEGAGKRWRVEAVLFKDGDRSTVYRKVWLSSALRSMRGRAAAHAADGTTPAEETP